MQARVIKLSGIGPEALRGAIESGLVAEDVRAACERTVAENDRLRRELAVQRKVNAKQSAVIREYRAERLAVYDTDTDSPRLGWLALGVGIGAVITMLATVVV